VQEPFSSPLHLLNLSYSRSSLPPPSRTCYPGPSESPFVLLPYSIRRVSTPPFPAAVFFLGSAYLLRISQPPHNSWTHAAVFLPPSLRLTQKNKWFILPIPPLLAFSSVFSGSPQSSLPQLLFLSFPGKRREPAPSAARVKAFVRLGGSTDTLFPFLTREAPFSQLPPRFSLSCSLVSRG